MKQLTIALGVILSSVAANSFAAVQSGTSPFNVCVPSLCGGFNIGVTGYWWRVSDPHRDYALRYPATAIDPATPFFPFDPVFDNGRNHSVEHDHEWAYRINVGYVFPCTGNDVTLAYTNFNHHEHDSVVRGSGVIFPTLTGDTAGGVILVPGDLTFDFPAPLVDITFGEIFAVLGLPVDATGIGGVPVDFASARSEHEYHAWDLEFGQYVNVGCNTRLRWFGGLRYAKLENNLDVTYSGALTGVDVLGIGVPPLPADVITATLSLDASVTSAQKSDFDGIGPRFGLNVSYNFVGGFGIVAESSAALLVGEIDSRFREIEHVASTFTITSVAVPTATATVTSDEVDSFHHPDETRVVPNLEGKIGLDYSFVFCNSSKSKLTVEAGYFVTHYWNTVDRLSDVAEVAPEFRTRHTIDSSFEGPYASLQFQF